MSYDQHVKLVEYINAPECPILNLFLDWNPLLDENWRGLETHGNDSNYKFKKEDEYPF
jgi:hypothetical protein